MALLLVILIPLFALAIYAVVFDLSECLINDRCKSSCAHARWAG